MIQARELRIGNWVKGIGHNVIWLVEGVEKGFIFSYNHWRVVESFEPIPLTEEWLINFGFEIDDSEWFKDDDEIVYKKTYKDYSICVSNKGVIYNGVYSQRIKHVHQLQNLCFALTGEELTIKNEKL